MSKIILSDRFAQIISDIGVKSVFTLTGGHIVPLLDSCHKQKIEIVDVRHEQNAIFAAEGYSRISGKLGVALVTAGPGFMNSINSIATAHFSNVPLLVVSGRHYRRQEGKGGLQEFDHPPMVKKITKFASTINNPEEFEGKINKAIESCFNGRGGPSFIDIPLDVQVELVSKAKNSPKLKQNIELDKPSSKKLLSTRNAISKAKRPVLLIGSKVESINELNKFVSSNKLPTYLSGQARGSVPFNSKYFFSRSRKHALSEADLVLSFGVDYDFRLKYGEGISKDAKIVAIDPDKEKLSWNITPSIQIHTALDSAIKKLSNYKIKRVPNEWLNKLREIEEKERERIEDAIAIHRGFHPEEFAKIVSEHIGEDAIVAVDGGDVVSSTAKRLQTSKQGWLLDPGPFGSLGTGPGYALGAKVARRDIKVYIIFGDGGFGFNGFEFDTFVRMGIQIIGIVGMDGVWNNIKTFHEAYSPGNTVADTLGYRPYHKYVESMGGYGQLVRKPKDLIPALKKAEKSGKPSLINVQLDQAVRNSSNYDS